jgi:CheY-like chemotaxis protein
MTPATHAASDPGANEPSGLCVLIVEDDEADAYLIGRTLSDYPAIGKVVRARDGAEALTMVECGDVAPDLAFVDLQMPRMNGFDLLVALRGSAKAQFPMVVLTSSAARNDAVKSRLRSATRVVIKPDTVAELYAVLANAIEATCPPGARAALASSPKTPDYLFQGPPPPAGIRRAPALD